MKLLTPTALVSLLPAGDELVNGALERFELLAPMLFREPGFCRTAVAEGWTTPQVVCVRGEPAYFITYHSAPDGGLWIDIAQRLDAGADIFALEAGINQLARRERARYIRMTTARRGLAEICQRSGGYQVEAVLMCKEVR